MTLTCMLQSDNFVTFNTHSGFMLFANSTFICGAISVSVLPYPIICLALNFRTRKTP